MKLLHPVGLGLLALAIACAARAQTEWRHERLQAGLDWVNDNPYTNMISPSGHAVYTAIGPLGMNVFLGSVNYSSLVAHGPHGAEAVGITDEGLPIWGLGQDLYVGLTDISSQYGWGVPWAPAPQRGRGGHISYTAHYEGRYFAVLDGEDISTPVLGEDGESRGVSAPNSSGQVCFCGTGEGTDGYRDQFFEGVNISKPLLGGNRSTYGRDFNEAGQVLWEGKGSKTSGKWKVFLDDRDITTPVFGAQGYGHPWDLNDAGQVMWQGGTTIGTSYIMLDDRNVSLPVVGSGPQVAGAALSENGHVLWTAVDDEGDFNLYLDDFNLSLAAIGDPRATVSTLTAMNASGHVAWCGAIRSGEPKVCVYYDTFNLTEDALGDIVIASWALEIGDAGHVLWYCDSTEFPGKYDVWLSTPIPEPSMLLLALPLLLLSHRRRPRRAPATRLRARAAGARSIDT
jgi:hypothetical protein